MIIALLRRAFSTLVKAILTCGNVLNIKASGLVYFPVDKDLMEGRDMKIWDEYIRHRR